jgi:hypothetical protein
LDHRADEAEIAFMVADAYQKQGIDVFNCHLDLTAQIRAPRNLAVKSRVPRNYVQFGTAQ